MREVERDVGRQVGVELDRLRGGREREVERERWRGRWGERWKGKCRGRWG